MAETNTATSFRSLLEIKTKELTGLFTMRDLVRKALKHLREIGIEAQGAARREYADHIEISLERISWNAGRTQYLVHASLWVGKNGKAVRIDPTAVPVPLTRKELPTSIEQETLYAVFKELRGFVPLYEQIPGRVFLRVAIVHEDVVKDLEDGFNAHIRFEGF